MRAGQLIGGKYLLLEPLGSGGMGQVWAARNLSTEAEVAIKVLHTTAGAPEAAARFRREAYATAQLTHRGIIRTFDLVEDVEADGSLAIVMERLRGKTLAEHLRKRAPLSIEETIGIVSPILHALHHAHHFGIVHRDLKPENIFLAVEIDGEVTPKLLDFGISKLLHDGNPPITGGGQIVGTPYHMSPEQLRGAAIDARSDVFCAGIVLYMCLAGTHPFLPEDSVRSVLAVLEVDPVRPKHLPKAVWEVVRRALAKAPTARFGSAQELADALARSMGNTPSRRSAPRPSDNVPTLTGTLIVPRGLRGRDLGLGAAACLVVLWIGLAGGATTPVRAATAAGEGAEREARPPRRLRARLDVLAGQAPPARAAPAATTSAITTTSMSESGRTAATARDSGF
jgi:serine/threonine protein kinase